MSSSYDRTLLAQLGFQDPDLKDARHDAACMYLAEPEQTRRLVELFVLSQQSFRRPDVDRFDLKHGFNPSYPYRVTNIKPELEFALSKRGYKSSFTVGFVDLIVRCKLDWLRCPTPNEREFEITLAVEVKIGRVGIGQLLRQINLYREHSHAIWCNYDDTSWSSRGGQWRPRETDPPIWIVAAPFRWTEAERQTLERERIHTIDLANGFQAYLARSNA